MNKTKKQLLKKIWDWIKIISLLLGIICGGLLIYNWWSREQKVKKLENKLTQLEQEAKQQYQLQNNYLVSTADLVNSSAIHSFFTDLLTTYAEKFAKNKNLDTSRLPLKFAGLYSNPKTGNDYGEMGRCSPHQIIYPTNQREINISLNRLYLLNKFSQDKYFTSNPQHGDYTYIDISFNKMMETCAHEIAHYIQLVKHGRSSCKSDLMLNNRNYDGELSQEHKEFSKEIYEMIKSSREYLELERKWKEIK